MTESTNITGSESSVLHMHNVSHASSAEYSVIVLSAFGELTSSAAQLLVVSSPVITLQPLSQTNLFGGTVTFSVAADSAGIISSVQWMKNGTNVLFDSDRIAGCTNFTLTISNLLGGDAGNYSAVLGNSLGTITSSNAALVVIDPVIIRQPTTFMCNAGDSATFTVEAKGEGPLAYQWLKDGYPLEDSMHITGVHRLFPCDHKCDG